MFNISGYNVLTLYVVLWMSRSINEINARCLKFVKTCININNYHAILHKMNMWFGKTELRL